MSALEKSALNFRRSEKAVSIKHLMLGSLFWLSTTVAMTDVVAADAKVADIARFLDPGTPSAQRQEIFSRWHKAAIAGDIDAQYVIGSLYRRGDDIQPEVVARDADMARRYLSTAAANGRVVAMAKMAELELAENRPLDAMIWTQIYGYYRGWVGNAGHSGEQPESSQTTYFAREHDVHGKPRPTIYFEDLLLRVQKKLVSVPNAVVLERLNDFIVAHDQDVRAHLVRDGLSAMWKDEKIQFTNEKSTVEVHPANSVSEWVMEFAPDGSVSSARLFDAIPDVVKAHGHHGVIAQIRANAVASDHRPRYLVHTAEWKRAPRMGEAP